MVTCQCFSSLIDAILYERYTYYLRNEIEKIELRELNNSIQRHSTIVCDDIESSQPKEKPVVVGNEINPFKSDFSEKQIEILRQFGIRKFSKKLVISLLFCNFIVENQSLTKHI